MSGNNAPNANPWDAPFLRRPSLQDFNNAQKTDDPNAPAPDPSTMPNSAEENTVKFCLVAMGQMIPSAEVSVTAGGSPAITSTLSPTDTLNGNLGAFTITRNAAGDYWVELTTASSALALIGQPRAYLNVVGGAHNYSVEATYGTGPAHSNPAARVTTQQDGVLTDLNFTVVFR